MNKFLIPTCGVKWSQRKLVNVIPVCVRDHMNHGIIVSRQVTLDEIEIT